MMTVKTVEIWDEKIDSTFKNIVLVIDTLWHFGMYVTISDRRSACIDGTLIYFIFSYQESYRLHKKHIYLNKQPSERTKEDES